jgi:hypothetical protein
MRISPSARDDFAVVVVVVVVVVFVLRAARGPRAVFAERGEDFDADGFLRVGMDAS